MRHARTMVQDRPPDNALLALSAIAAGGSRGITRGEVAWAAGISYEDAAGLLQSLIDAGQVVIVRNPRVRYALVTITRED